MARQWTVDEVLNIVRTFQPACVLVAAAELDIFTVLRKRPTTAQSLANQLGCDLRATTILLDVLTALGFLTKQANIYSVLPEAAEILTEAGTHNVLPAVRHLGNCLRRWAQLARVIQTGKPAESSPSIRGAAADQADFIGAMHNFSAPITNQIIDELKPLTFNHLLDIGGGSGTWTIAFLRAVPQAKATLFDLPDVISLARQRIAEAGLSNRVTFVAGNYFEDELPSGADFAWLSAITHQNSRKQNRQLFAKIHAALQANGVLVLRDVVMDESRTSPEAGAIFAVNMLVATEAGGTYTFDEFRQDLADTGFTDVSLIRRDEFMDSLIRAKKLQG
ncbi:MAG: methyltransferase [Sedimentisphaerales bacterium]